MDHTLLKRILGSAILVVFLTFIIAALQFDGVVDMGLGRLLFFLAWLVGVGGILFSEWLWVKDLRDKIFVGVVSAIFLGICFITLDMWALKHKPVDQAKDGGDKETRTSESRIDVTELQVIPLRNPQNQVGAAISVFYANHGSIPFSTMSHRAVLVMSPTLLSPDQERTDQDITMKGPSPPPINGDEVQPGDLPRHLFSIPEDDERMYQLGAQIPLIKAGRTRLYLFVTFKYRDAELAKGKIRVTEFCGTFYHQVDAWHECGTNRTYITDDQ